MKKLLTSFLLAGLWIVGLHVNATTHYLENTNFSNGDRKLQTFGTYRIDCNNYVDASNSFGVAEIDCMPTASKYINPNMEYMADYALLDVTLEATPDEFCLGSVDLPFDLTTYFTAGTTTGGTWSSSGPDPNAVYSIAFSPNLPGTYILTYTVGTDSESITVTVYPSIYAWLLPITVCAMDNGTINLNTLLDPSATTGGVFSIEEYYPANIFTSVSLSASGTDLIYTLSDDANFDIMGLWRIDVGYTVTSASTTYPCSTSYSEMPISFETCVEDCLGVLNGPAIVGASCDDGNPNTINDMYNSNCTCVGTCISSAFSTTITTAITVCDSIYTWAVNGTTYNESGSYTYVIGCHTEVLVLTLTLSFTGLNTNYCSADPSVLLMGCAAPLGTFDGPGITDHRNGTATFNPANAGNGGTITYSIGTWASVSVGEEYTVALKPDGTLWAWGYNGLGQLGIGNYVEQNSPVQVENSNNWASVSAGQDHSIAIKTDGTLWAWGQNFHGKLGIGQVNGIYSEQLSPVQAGTDNNWSIVSAGTYHSLAIKTDGTLWVWGDNSAFQLGTGNFNDQVSPVQIGTDTNWASVSAGQDHSVALKTDGTLWGWGMSYFGQLGTGTNNIQYIPVQAGTDNNWASISAGKCNSLALKTDGTLWAWGYNNYGQLGIGNNTNQFSPVQVGSDNNWAHISVGEYYVLAIKTDGTLWSWGRNTTGQLGIGNTTSQNSPVQVGTANNWKSVSAGVFHSFAQKLDGSLWAWGYNGSGQLGIGNYSIQQNSPVQVGLISSTSQSTTITPSSSNSTTISACDSYIWSVNGTTYTTSGTYTEVNGCHTETLNLTITPSSSNTTTITACDNYLWSLNGTTYTTSGTYTEVIGCHTETLNLTITPSTTNTTTITACGSYTWVVNNQTYTTSGTYTSVSGCHTEVLTLTITGACPDCLGVPGGTALPGTACVDGNPNTSNDVFGSNCICAGTPLCNLGATINGSTNVCAGKVLSLTATGGTQYQWSGPNGYTANGGSITRNNANISMSGVYYVTVTNNTCVDVVGIIVTVHPLPIATITGTTPVCSGGTISISAPAGGVSYQWSGPNGFSTNTGSSNTLTRTNAITTMGGQYKVTVTNVGGCTASASKSISVSGVPTASVTGATNVCGNNTVNLTATTAGVSYVWTGPGGFGANTAAINAPPVAGQYKVTVTGSTGCISSANRNVTVTAPPNAIISGNTNVCLGGTINLIASGGNSYSWSGPNGYTKTGSTVLRNNANATMSGTYTVTVTGSGGCKATAGVFVSITCKTTEEPDQPTLTAYPNPFTQTATIAFTLPETTEAVLKVYGIDGREVAQLFNGIAEAGHPYTVELDGTGLAVGIYIVSLTGQTGVQQRYRLVLTK